VREPLAWCTSPAYGARMSYTRPEWPGSLYHDFKALAAGLGYKSKGRQGKWLLLRRLFAFAGQEQNRDLFRNDL
jgi:hypothetical protein